MAGALPGRRAGHAVVALPDNPPPMSPAPLFSALACPPPAAGASPRERFLHTLRAVLVAGQFRKLLLSGPMGEDDGLERLTVRALLLRGEPALSFLWRHRTKDITKNHAPEAGLAELAALLGTRFRHAHLHTDTEALAFALSRKGRESLHRQRIEPAPDGAGALPEAADPCEGPARPGAHEGAGGPGPRDRPEAQAAPAVPGGPGGPAAGAAMASSAHDKAKVRPLALGDGVWRGLGLTHLVRGEPALVPAMARKWKQINRFVEILAAAVDEAGLHGPSSGPIRVADFGAGKGYLSFAVHDWLQRQGLQPQVTGLELREDMVRLCNALIADEQLQGIRFDQGDVRTQAVQPLDVMIALHACDIATDHALHVGLQSGARIIMSSPCCHKELRPQMQLPPVLRPMLQHGIHLGQEAEMVTDALRALLLESQGYRTQVFEFIALEHTSKNKMILAVKARGAAAQALAARRPELLAQVAEIKRFYGLREQRLEQLLAP